MFFFYKPIILIGSTRGAPTHGTRWQQHKITEHNSESDTGELAPVRLILCQNHEKEKPELKIKKQDNHKSRENLPQFDPSLVEFQEIFIITLERLLLKT